MRQSTLSNRVIPKTPPVSMELVEWVERMFPPPIYKPGMTLEDVAYQAGKAEAANRLRLEHERQYKPVTE